MKMSLRVIDGSGSQANSSPAERPVFKVIDGSRQYDDILDRYNHARLHLDKMEREQKIRLPIIFKKELMYDLKEGNVLKKHKRYSDFMGVLSPDIYLGDFRPADEIIKELFVWDRSEQLDRDETGYLYSIFAEEISRFYFQEELEVLGSPDDAGHALNHESAEHALAGIISKGIESLYRHNYNLMLKHHDFFHSLYCAGSDSTPGLFRNAWVLWYEHIGNYSIKDDLLGIAKDIDYLCSIAYNNHDLEEFKAQAANLERKISRGIFGHRKAICSRISERLTGAKLDYLPAHQMF